MKNLLLLILIAPFSCASIAQKTQKPPQEIAAVYYQNWSGGQELSGSGTDFYIEFKKPLANDIQLIQLLFRKRITKLDKVSETMYVGRYLRRAELVTDANGNRNIVHIEPETVKSELSDNEAILKYSKTKRNRSFKFKKIEEKEMLAYPSAPPRN